MSATKHDEGCGEPAWRKSCKHTEDALPYVLGELSDAAHGDYCEHLLEGCAACGRELETTRRDVASLDLALANRAQLESGRAAFEETRASLGLRLRARVSASSNQALSSAGQDPGTSPVPCPPLESTNSAGIEVAPRDGNNWVELEFPGVRMRVLSTDPERHRWTVLMEMAPGSCYPAHRHAGVEECLVLSGDIDIGGRVLRRGDFQVAHADSLHAAHTSEGGCQLLVVSSWDNEVMPTL